MSRPVIYYEIIIAPNSTNDVPSPREYAELMWQPFYIDLLEKLLPEFDKS